MDLEAAARAESDRLMKVVGKRMNEIEEAFVIAGIPKKYASDAAVMLILKKIPHVKLEKC